MTSMWRRRLMVTGLLNSMIACAGTPVTEPPSVAPPDLADINAAETVPAFNTGQPEAPIPIGLAGGRGAVEADSLVWTINLDSTAPPSLLRADADGSFRVPVQAQVGDELRMHVWVDDAVSPPLDMVVSDGLLLAAPDDSTCVRTMPTQMNFGESAAGAPRTMDLLIENTCALPLDLAVALHPSASDFALSPLDDDTLAEGETTTLSVTFDPAEGPSSLRSSVLLIQIASADGGGRVAVSLWGRSR